MHPDGYTCATSLPPPRVAHVDGHAISTSCSWPLPHNTTTRAQRSRASTWPLGGDLHPHALLQAGRSSSSSSSPGGEHPTPTGAAGALVVKARVSRGMGRAAAAAAPLRVLQVAVVLVAGRLEGQAAAGLSELRRCRGQGRTDYRSVQACCAVPLPVRFLVWAVCLCLCRGEEAHTCGHGFTLKTHASSTFLLYEAVVTDTQVGGSAAAVGATEAPGRQNAGAAGAAGRVAGSSGNGGQAGAAPTAEELRRRRLARFG